MEIKETLYANSLFEQPWWLDIVAPGNWDEVVIKDKDEVIARLPFILNKTKVKMPEWTQTLGIWMKEDIRTPKRGNTQKNKQKEIINELMSKLPKYKSLNMCLDSSNSYILPFRWLGYKFEPTFSYRISFDEKIPFDEITKKISKRMSRYIRASDKIIHIEESKNIDELIKLRELTFGRQRRKNNVDTNLMYSVIEKCLENNHGRLIYGIDDNGTIYNGSFCPFDKQSCYYLMGYNNPKYDNSHTLGLVTLNSIEFAYKNSSFFDFEGSMVEGIENYFRVFGGEQVINYNISKQSFLADCKDIAKPRIKKIIGYRL